jgi:hypothetical protein
MAVISPFFKKAGNQAELRFRQDVLLYYKTIVTGNALFQVMHGAKPYCPEDIVEPVHPERARADNEHEPGTVEMPFLAGGTAVPHVDGHDVRLFAKSPRD